jgi:translocation protein SEC62
MLLLGFVGFIMGLGVIRAVLWLVLKLTIGRGGWLFPNLFADCGFIESFIPVWAYIFIFN